MIDSWLKAAGSVSSAWSLSAFAIAAILALLTAKSTGRWQTSRWIGVIAIALLGLVPIVGSQYVQHRRNESTAQQVYRIHVSIYGPKGQPIDQARVWSSVGGEPKQVSGGWQIDVPASVIPHDRRVRISSSVEPAFLTGHSNISLAGDYNPSVMITLAQDTSAEVGGIIVDANHRSIAGVRVSVVGFSTEAVTTDTSGGFRLQAHAADNQQVEIHAEKLGYDSVDVFQLAGDLRMTIVM